MEYYIDGYNLLFHVYASLHDLQSKREKVIELLHEKFSELQVPCTIVFDGAHLRGEESGFQYKRFLQIIYSPKGESADDYILEKLTHSKRPSNYTVVTSDRTLGQRCRQFGAHTKTIQAFLSWIDKKTQKGTTEEKFFQDSKKNMDRLLKIFERKLKDEEDF